MSIRIIGDVHGKFDDYKKIVDGSSHSVQLGDFGFESTWNKLHYSGLDPEHHKIIKGNHDQYDFESPFDLGDFGEYTLNGVKFFFIRGGISIDRVYREGERMSGSKKTWWSQEELNFSQMLECMTAYEKSKPDIVLSHVPCATFSKIMSPSDAILQRFGFHEGFKENHQLLGDELLKVHQPSVWFSAHFHIKMNHQIENTRFVGLAELGYVDFDISDLR